MGVEKVKEAAELMRRSLAILGNGPLDFYLTELVAAHELLMGRYAPFKVGDRVKLASTPLITEKVRYGWMGWRTLLVEGASGVVVRADCGSKGFSFGIHFDNDKNSGGKGEFCFGEFDLLPA